MRKLWYNVLGLVCLLQLICKGQTTFDAYYKTGYHSNKSSNVIARPDSNCVFVNYTVDSLTSRLDVGLLMLDKNGNEVIKNSFNMFNKSYNSFTSGMKNFIEATPSSYFLSGSYFVGNDQSFILNKFSRTTLDTLKTVIYSNPGFHAILGITKLNDNKYFLIGNTGNSTSQWPIMLQVDSNLNILQTINIATSNNFFVSDAIYNPVTKKILLAGCTASGQYLNTFVYIDTLGIISQIAFGAKYYQYRHILQMYFSPVDSTYIAIGDLKTGIYGNIGLYKLCISKYDVNLNLKWEKTYGDAMPASGLLDAVVLNDGSTVVSGAYSAQTSFPLANANMNGIILKVNKNGNLKWAREYDHVPAGSLIEQFYGIDKTIDKGFILCGSIIGPPTNKSKAWAVKTDSLGCVTPNCLSSVMQVDSIIYPPLPVDTTNMVGIIKRGFNPDKKLNVYPNPTSEFLKIEFTENATVEKREYELVIVNTLGQVVSKYKSTGETPELDVSYLKVGIYFLQIFEMGKQVAVEKFAKE